MAINSNTAHDKLTPAWLLANKGLITDVVIKGNNTVAITCTIGAQYHTVSTYPVTDWPRLTLFCNEHGIPAPHEWVDRWADTRY